VSVATPAFNAAYCIPWAVASLVAQTFENWECVIVDDGSTDRTADVAEACEDPRIRIIRLAENEGRAVARRVALENSRGEFLCMLDSDDWYHPNKLEDQLKVFEDAPELGLVSGGMAIVDERDNLVGVRAAISDEDGSLRVCPPIRSLLSPDVFHAPSMIRMDLAKRCTYSPQLTRAEDFHFMAQVLALAPYAINETFHYVYSEPASVGREGLVDRYRAARAAYSMLRDRYPISSSLGGFKATCQAAMARNPFTRRVAERIFRKGSRPPSAAELERYDVAKNEVQLTLERLRPH
jgi:glycosyltransferase involved in cell wall biosynthesis